MTETVGVVPDAVVPDEPAEQVRMLGALLDTMVATADRMSAVPVDEIDQIVEATEKARRQLDYVCARQFMEVNDRGVNDIGGYKSPKTYYAIGQRLGPGAAKARAELVMALAPRTGLTGEALDPDLPVTAGAVAEGALGDAHVKVIAETMDKVPARFDADLRGRVEADLVEYGRVLPPNKLAQAAVRILAHLDPDGALSDDRDRQRRRSLRLGVQDSQLMTRIGGDLTPETAELLGLNLDMWAAPGMNNPDDPDSPDGAVDQPGLDPAVLAAAKERDLRTPEQRNHDAFLAMQRFLRTHRNPGSTSLGGELVITVRDQDLAAYAGVALTGSGRLVPIADLITMAAGMTPHLTVFRRHTREILYQGRGKRLATKSQRLALFGRDRGCTHPGCDAPFNRSEIHHNHDWAKGGNTDVDDLGCACGRHNRAVGDQPGQWETAIADKGRSAGRMLWRVTGHRDSWRLNPTHHPELVLEQGAHAPPATTATDDPDTWSGIEKKLQARFGDTV
ncbi:MAG: DUF222 domain-containing protein [Gordonia sp. (in: high G+C Gram-positive bacteria)]|uniref:HNH endonuclease signature motif containing protein n=1 Tax=Gordonia sp. (in: high G+C Gram-positive bacteria) TaxID=84139 RepID=UPI0039E47A06